MEITLEQGLASAIRYIQDNTAEGTEYYFGEIAEDYYVPSVYFQIPFLSGGKATLRTYKQTLTMNIWFMEHETWDAQSKAAEMLEKIMLDDCIFPIVSKDGSKTDRGLRIEEPATRKIDDGIVQLTFSFDAYFHSERNVEKIQKFYIEFQKTDRR